MHARIRGRQGCGTEVDPHGIGKGGLRLLTGHAELEQLQKIGKVDQLRMCSGQRLHPGPEGGIVHFRHLFLLHLSLVFLFHTHGVHLPINAVEYPAILPVSAGSV